MKRRGQNHAVANRVSFAMATAAIFLGGLIEAHAQRGGGSPLGGRVAQLSDEKQEAAWSLEARSVAKVLELDGSDSAKLVAAFQAARKEYLAGLRGLGTSIDAVRQHNEDQRAKLQASLQGSLSADQAKSAVATLGAALGPYNKRWDTLADALAGLNLADDQLFGALKVIGMHYAMLEKTRGEAMANFDLSGLTAVVTEAQAKLAEDLGAILSEEEMQSLSPPALGGRGGRGGRGGAERGRRGGGRGGRGAPGSN